METGISCRLQTQRYFYQAMTTQALITQLPITPTNISTFLLPSLLSPLTSIPLHNLHEVNPQTTFDNEHLLSKLDNLYVSVLKHSRRHKGKDQVLSDSKYFTLKLWSLVVDSIRRLYSEYV